MQVQNISSSNNTNFQGYLVLRGDFGTVATKQIRQAAPELKKLIKKEPFDLFVTQHRKGENIIEVYAQNIVDNFEHKDNKKISAFISETGDMPGAAESVIKEYKDKIQSKKLWERIKTAYFKFEDYYYEMLEDIGK